MVELDDMSVASSRASNNSVDSSRASNHEMRWVAVVAVASVVLLAARAPFAVSRFWAEDAVVFLQGARDEGILGAFDEPWAGYFHVIPRLVGGLTASVPISAAPYVNWVVLAMLIAWCAVTVFVASRTWVSGVVGRLFLASGVVLLPALGNESIGSVANLHFIMLFPSLLILISRSRSRPETVNGVVFLALATASTLQTVVLAPVVAYRFWSRKPRRPDVLSMVWVLGTAAHLLAVFVVGPDRPREATPTIIGLARSFGKGVLADNFAPTTRGAVVTGSLIALAVMILVARATWMSWKSNETERAVWLVLVPSTGVLLYLVLGWRLGYTTPRYAVFPAMCITWALIVSAQVLVAHMAPGHWVRRYGGAALLAALLLVIWLPHWPVDTYRSQGTSWSTTLSTAAARCDEEGTDVVVVPVPPSIGDDRLWPFSLRCDELP